MTPVQTQAAAIARLAGLANVVSALLAAMPIMEPDTWPDALKTCASMAAEVADELAAITSGTVPRPALALRLVKGHTRTKVQVDCCDSPTGGREDVA